uniref:F-box domain-containing protein n=1 Tax=Heterorhabditis bacteriophora TaxID=37862 RepID=A0A1I7WP10_HETBA
MALVNVAQCDDDVEASQESDIAAFTGCSFHDLPPQLQCHILRELHADDIRKLKRISKQLKCLIERHWSRAFSILPPKIQIKILTETAPGAYSVERRSEHNVKVISFEDFSRICAHCYFHSIEMREINITLDFCDQLQRLFRENRITCELVSFAPSNYTDVKKLTIVDRLLGATEATSFTLVNYEHRNLRFEKEFFRMPSVRKLKVLGLHGECAFSDDNLSAMDFRILFLHRCHISECTLRIFIEVMFTPDVLEFRRDIMCLNVIVQKSIDVDRLLSDLPNIGEGLQKGGGICGILEVEPWNL